MWAGLLASGLPRPQHQLRSPIPRTVPLARPARCINITRPIGLPVEDGSFALGDTFKDQGNRESVLCSSRGLVQYRITSKIWIRPLYGSGPLGRHHSPGLWQRRHPAMWTRPRLSRQSALEYGLLVTYAHRKLNQPSWTLIPQKQMDCFWWGRMEEMNEVTNSKMLSLKLSQAEII